MPDRHGGQALHRQAATSTIRPFRVQEHARRRQPQPASDPA